MNQIYRKTLMPKCNFNKFALQLYSTDTCSTKILFKLMQIYEDFLFIWALYLINKIDI